MRIVIVVVAVLWFAVPAVSAQDSKINNDSLFRFQPGIQLNVFGTAGGPIADGEEAIAWGFGGQATLLKLGPLSFGGGGLSIVELAEGIRVVPYAELVTINMRDTYGEKLPNIIGISVKYLFRNALYRDGQPLDHGIGIGFVFTGF